MTFTLGILFLLAVGVALFFSKTDPSVLAVRDQISTHLEGFNPHGLQAIQNPKGEGVIVFHPRREFLGIERILVWVVLDGEVYALNGASKNLTPAAAWPRENPDRWKKTGLNPYDPREAIEIVSD